MPTGAVAGACSRRSHGARGAYLDSWTTTPSALGLRRHGLSRQNAGTWMFSADGRDIDLADRVRHQQRARRPDLWPEERGSVEISVDTC